MNNNIFNGINSNNLKDDSSLDVNYNFSEENELNNNYLDQNLFKGSHVVLVSENNPWYVNKGVPLKYISNKEFTNKFEKPSGDPYGRLMYEHQDYKSDCELIDELPDLGFGHSILERKIAVGDKCIKKKDMNQNKENYSNNVNEGFSGNPDKMNRNILIFILLTLIIFYLYRKYKK
jgi:hypothetical protein